MLRSTMVIISIVLLALLYSPLHTGTLDGHDHSRVLLLTAHPDDEAMFFAPTLLGMRESERPPQLFSLCLSTGNADSLGEERIKELGKSLDVLGIAQERRWVIDHPDLQDNFTAAWQAHIIAEATRSYIINNNIDTILTFDYEGISSHPNHKSLPQGVIYMIHSFHNEGRSLPRLFTLVSVPLVAKFTSIFAPVHAKFDLFLGRTLNLLIPLTETETALSTGLPLSKHNLDWNARGMPVYVSGLREYIQALSAMRMHASQLVWFRWLYVAFSHYMWVNEWLEVNVH